MSVQEIFLCQWPRNIGIIKIDEYEAIKEENAASQRQWIIGNIEKLQEHLALQIKAQSKQQLKDASISSLEKEIRYLEGMLVKSKIKLAQAKSELDVSPVTPNVFADVPVFQLNKPPKLAGRGR